MSKKKKVELKVFFIANHEKFYLHLSNQREASENKLAPVLISIGQTLDESHLLQRSVT